MKGKRAQAELQGRRGEAFAAWYLRLTGWSILARRVKTPRGEVDLIARRRGTVCFVEVKWRRTSADLAFAIDAHRLRRVAAATEILAPRFAKQGEDIRVDVLLLSPWCWPRHIVNAWQPGA